MEGRKKALASFRASNRAFSGRSGKTDSQKNQTSQGSMGSVDPDEEKGMVLPFDPIIMTFKDVSAGRPQMHVHCQQHGWPEGTCKQQAWDPETCYVCREGRNQNP